MCQLTPLCMRPRVAGHFAQDSGMLAIELKQSTTFSELYSKHITLVPMLSAQSRNGWLIVSRCGSFAWRRFESRVLQGAQVRLLGAPGAADYFLGASIRCAPAPGSGARWPPG